MSGELEWLSKIKRNVDSHRKPEQKKDQCEAKIIERNVELPRKKGFAAIAGMETLKELILEGFINVLKNPAKAELYGVTVPNLLLYGPSGCGKTYFAERIAEEVGVNFMKVCPDDISSIYIHGTQKKIGELFKKAEEKRPTIIFFDEFDSMAPRRTGDSNRQYNTDEVNEFLTMLNNTANRGVYVIVATNHPENIDASILRTGRIDEKIYISMPDKKTREELFRFELRNRPISQEINYEKLAELSEGYNCSDINYIVKKAARQKFNNAIKSTTVEPITHHDLMEAISSVTPSVSESDLRSFERLKNSFLPNAKKSNQYQLGFL